MPWRAPPRKRTAVVALSRGGSATNRSRLRRRVAARVRYPATSGSTSWATAQKTDSAVARAAAPRPRLTPSVTAKEERNERDERSAALHHGYAAKAAELFGSMRTLAYRSASASASKALST